MTVKYHINDKGDVNPCRAKIKCIFASSDHGFFESKEEARQWAEAKEKEKHEEIFSVFESDSKDLSLEIPEELLKEHYKIRASFEKARRDNKPLSLSKMGFRNNYIEKLTSFYRDQGESTNEKYATLSPDGTESYVPWRRKQQIELIKDFLKDKVNKVGLEGKAIFAGGLGGSGKSTVLNKYAGVRTEKYVTINPDDIKEMMAERGMIPTADSITPMEMSTLAHEEASTIANEIAGMCLKRRMNIIYDGTMGSVKSIQRKVKGLQNNGYTDVRAVFVSISPDESKKRGVERYVRGVNAFIAGQNSIGGRPLPGFVVDDQKPESDKFKSKNEENLIELYRQGCFTEMPKVFDNNTWGQTPQERDFIEFAL